MGNKEIVFVIGDLVTSDKGETPAIKDPSLN